jgi:hypothetical protein
MTLLVTVVTAEALPEGWGIRDEQETAALAPAVEKLIMEALAEGPLATEEEKTMRRLTDEEISLFYLKEIYRSVKAIKELLVDMGELEKHKNEPDRAR